MANKEVGIYLIDKRKFMECRTNEEVIVKLEDEIGTQYKQIELEENCIDGYKIKLYNRISHIEDTWNSFWKCKESKSDVRVKEMSANNYIAFIYNKNNIFAITSNMAYHDINKVIVYFYGVCIMSYFIKDDDKIRSATYNNIMSNFLGGSEYLVEDYQTTVDKYWDRINTKLMAEVDKERLYNELGIENKRKTLKVRCDAKDSFTICSKIDIYQLIAMIEKLDKISTDKLLDRFNTIERIKDEKLEIELKEQLVKKIYDDYKKSKLDICILHKEMEVFFGSMSYSFMYEDNVKYTCDNIPNNRDLKCIFDEMEVNSLEDIKNIFNRLQLLCFNSDRRTILSNNLETFINVTIEYNGKEYLFQNKIWYKLTDNYISNLNNVFRFIKNSFVETNIELKKWEGKNEGEYIDLYDNMDNFYKIHPKTEDGIEVCDLMYIDKKNEEIKMIFFKDGFGASTRDLAIQVTMGVQKFLSILKDNERIKDFYLKYIKAKSPQYSFQNFKEEAKSFSKNAVMVYKLPKNSKENSNIGKQSVIFAKTEIEKLGRCKFTMKQL